MGKHKDVTSIVRTKASQQYRDLTIAHNERTTKWAEALSKVRGLSVDEIQAEVIAFFLQELRNTDDLATMSKVNIATLTMKEQLKFETKKAHLERKYNKAIDEGDEQLAEIIYEEIIELLTDTEADYKKFKAINDAIKTMKSLEPKSITVNTQSQDDKMIFDIKDGVYTEE